MLDDPYVDGINDVEGGKFTKHDPRRDSWSDSYDYEYDRGCRKAEADIEESKKTKSNNNLPFTPSDGELSDFGCGCLLTVAVIYLLFSWIF